MKPVWDLARLNYEPMRDGDINEVVALEESVYPYPWSRGNFADSLASG